MKTKLFRALLPTTLLLVASSQVLAEEERFYGKERFTLIGTQTGTETGTFTEHVRDYGRKRVEIKNATLSMMGFTQKTHTRAIFDRADIVTVDLNTGAVTKATNPHYAKIVESMRGRDGVELGKQMMTAMGARPTGKKGEYAGESCDYWELPQMSTLSCVTSWGATLHNKTTMAGVTVERQVTEIRQGEGGPDAAFQYDASKVRQAPNLEDILGKMKRGGG
jgi:hypothetical protein